MNSRGPRTEPWGTPHKQAHEEERWLSHVDFLRRGDIVDSSRMGWKVPEQFLLLFTSASDLPVRTI